MRLPAGMLLALVLALGACTPLYVAPALNAPLLSEPGEVHAFGTLEATSGAFDAALAIAPVDRVAVIGGYSVGPRGDDDHEHTYGEIAAGTFLPFGQGRFEAFLGAGYGDASGEIVVDSVDDRLWIQGQGDYARFFAQIDVGLTFGFLDLGGVMRAAHVTFWHTAAENGQRRTARELFWEVGSFIRLGWTALKFELQMQFLIPTIPDLNVAMDVFQIALGIHLAFDLF
jgi:hypothetical protein